MTPEQLYAVKGGDWGPEHTAAFNALSEAQKQALVRRGPWIRNWANYGSVQNPQERERRRLRQQKGTQRHIQAVQKAAQEVEEQIRQDVAEGIQEHWESVEGLTPRQMLDRANRRAIEQDARNRQIIADKESRLGGPETVQPNLRPIPKSATPAPTKSATPSKGIGTVNPEVPQAGGVTLKPPTGGIVPGPLRSPGRPSNQQPMTRGGGMSNRYINSRMSGGVAGFGGSPQNIGFGWLRPEVTPWALLPGTTPKAEVLAAAKQDNPGWAAVALIDHSRLTAVQTGYLVAVDGGRDAMWAGSKGGGKWEVPVKRGPDIDVPVRSHTGTNGGTTSTGITPLGGYDPMAGMCFGCEPMIIQVRRCPGSARLAKNGLCYEKSMLPAALRENRSKKAPVSWSDANHIRKGAAAGKRLKTWNKRVAGIGRMLAPPRRRITRKASK